MKKILIFLIPVLILLFNFRLMVYDFDNEEVRDFLKGKGSLVSYSEQEIMHLQDVKLLIDDVNFIFYSLIVIFVLLISYFVYKKINFSKEIMKGCFFIMLLVLILGLIFYFDFERLFYYFHIIAFSNDYWLLSKDSLLLEQFPMEFFSNFVFNLLIRSFIMALIILVITKSLLKFKIIKY